MLTTIARTARAAPRLALGARACSAAAYSTADADADIRAHALAVFTKSYCSFCRDLIERLDDAGVPHREVQLDRLGASYVCLPARACAWIPCTRAGVRAPVRGQPRVTARNSLPRRPCPHADPGNVVRDELKVRTGHPYVPFVFLAGAPVEGDAFVTSLKVPSGSPPGTRPPAEAALAAAGLRATGYFRP